LVDQKYKEVEKSDLE